MIVLPLLLSFRIILIRQGGCVNRQRAALTIRHADYEHVDWLAPAFELQGARLHIAAIQAGGLDGFCADDHFPRGGLSSQAGGGVDVIAQGSDVM